MLATSLQQWARRYLRVTQPKRCSPQQRARSREFFANGVEKLHVPWTVEALPAMVHLSMFVFLAGLLVYLFNINLTVFKTVVCWVALLSTIYGFITILPIFRHDSPYHSPLSSAVWKIPAILPYAVLEVLEILGRNLFAHQAYLRIFDLRLRCNFWIYGGVEFAAQETIFKNTSEIDGRILQWTVNSLNEDGALETLVESIPGFYKSDVVKGISKSAEWVIQYALGNFLQRTLSSNSVSELVKHNRLTICLDAAVEALDSFRAGLMFTHLLNVN
jgi:Family of unknown function (DUF6535)